MLCNVVIAACCARAPSYRVRPTWPGATATGEIIAAGIGCQMSCGRASDFWRAALQLYSGYLKLAREALPAVGYGAALADLRLVIINN